MAEAATTDTGTPALEVSKLSCGYSGIQVVHDLDLTIQPGQVVAMLGANGAGKSTTLLTIAGVLTPISGRVSIHGEPCRGPLQQRVRRGLGILKETTSVFPTLNVARNLAIGRAPTERVYEIAPELRALEHRRGGLLSGGEQRILGLARALAADPSVLLVDELSLGLAPMITNRLLRLLRQHADRGTAVLLVEQHPHRALTVADRVVVFRRGRIVHEGDAAEMRDRVDDLHHLYFGT